MLTGTNIACEHHDGLPSSLIKYILAQRGYSLARIAREEKVHRSYISLHVTGRRRTRKIRKAIARRMGLSPRVVFGCGDQKRKAS